MGHVYMGFTQRSRVRPSFAGSGATATTRHKHWYGVISSSTVTQAPAADRCPHGAAAWTGLDSASVGAPRRSTGYDQFDDPDERHRQLGRGSPTASQCRGHRRSGRQRRAGTAGGGRQPTESIGQHQRGHLLQTNGKPVHQPGSERITRASGVNRLDPSAGISIRPPLTSWYRTTPASAALDRDRAVPQARKQHPFTAPTV